MRMRSIDIRLDRVKDHLDILCYNNARAVSMDSADTRDCCFGNCNCWRLMMASHNLDKNEPPRGKTNNVVSEQVRHKPTCTATEKSKKLEILDLSTRGAVLSG